MSHYEPTEEDVQSVIDDLEYWASLRLTPEQVRELVKESPDLQEEFDVFRCMEGTGMRDLFMDAIARKVTGRHWLVNAEPLEVKVAFGAAMDLNAAKHGYHWITKNNP